MSDDIGKVADDVIGRMKTTEELKHVPFEMYARVLARAERAEAECRAMREALVRFANADNWCDGVFKGNEWPRPHPRDIARTALNPSPAAPTAPATAQS